MSDLNQPPVLQPESPEMTSPGGETPYSQLRETLEGFVGKLKSGVTEPIQEFTQKASSGFEETKTGFQDMLLGPFGQISKSLFNISGSDIFQAGPKLKKLFGKGDEEDGKVTDGRVSPKDTSLLKYGALGAGFVYLGRQMGQGEGPDLEGMEDGGFLSNLLGGRGRGIGGLGKILAAAGPWALLAGALAGTAVAFTKEWDKEAETMGEEIRDVWRDDTATLGQKLLVTGKNVGKGIFGALAGGVRGVVENTVEVAGNLRDIWQDDEKNIAQKVLGTFGEGLRFTFGNVWEFAKGFGETVFNGIVGLLPEEKQEAVREWVGTAKENINNFMVNVGDFFKNIGQGIGDFSRRAARSVGNFFTEGVPNFFNRVKENVFHEGSVARKLYQNSLGRFVNMASGVGEGIGNFFRDVKDRGFRAASTTVINNAANKIGDFFNTASDWVGDFFGQIKEEGLGATLEQRINAAVGDAASETGIRGFFARSANRVGQFFGDIQREGLGSAVGDIARDVGAKVQGFFTGLGETVTGFMGVVGEQGLGSAIGGVLGGLSQEQQNALSKIRETIGEEQYAAELDAADKKFLVPNQKEFLESDRFLELARQAGVRNARSIQNVNDAIITRDGNVIRTNPNDSIIATQSNIAQLENAVRLSASERSAMTGGMNVEQLHQDLLNLINTIQNKPFNNQIIAAGNSGGNFSADQLRYGTEGTNY